MVIIITSFNNQDWYQKNLDSVYLQDYENYRVIYIDDCSPDGTGLLVEAYVKERGQEFRTTIIRNPEWRSQMANHYLAVYMCDDNEIVCQLDGDDHLYDENTLNRVNETYLSGNVWLTVGRPLHSTGERLPDIRPNQAQIIQKNSYRQDGWYFNHLRTFKAWLFKLIKVQDFFFRGNFANMAPAPDVAMMYPMYEMAGKHGRVIYDLLYVINVRNPIRQCYLKPAADIQDLQDIIRFEWPEYSPLYAPVLNRIAQFENKMTDLIMWADQIDDNLAVSLEAIRTYMSHVNTVFIVYHETNNNQPVIADLKQEFPHYIFLHFNPSISFFSAVKDYVLSKAGDYVIFTTPTFVIDKHRDLSVCIQYLERTFAHAFYLHLSFCDEIKPLCGPLWDNLIAWQPAFAKHIWEYPNKLGMVLYRKNDIEQEVIAMKCKTIDEFVEQWSYHPMEERIVGLFYK